MFLGVVANPIPERDFDGKIFLKHVARMEMYKQATCNQNFTNDASAYGLIKDGDWYDSNAGVIVEGMTLGDLKEAISGQFFLNKTTASRRGSSFGTTLAAVTTAGASTSRRTTTPSRL